MMSRKYLPSPDKLVSFVDLLRTERLPSPLGNNYEVISFYHRKSDRMALGYLFTKVDGQNRADAYLI
jgi:hypothetical protein